MEEVNYLQFEDGENRPESAILLIKWAKRSILLVQGRSYFLKNR